MKTLETSFFNAYAQGFLRVAVATPSVRVADPQANARSIASLALEAHAQSAALVIFPELALSGYAIDDLLQQEALLASVAQAIASLKELSRQWLPVLAVGAPLRHEGQLYNTAVIIHRGRILGVVPKSYLPNYREFYERRHFASGVTVKGATIALAGEHVPFGTDLLFAADDIESCALHFEICEDLWVPVPESSFAAMAGATVLANLSASNAIIGKADYRHNLCLVHSARNVAASLYSAAGRGESTTDLSWDGQATIYENGRLLKASERFAPAPGLIFSDIDLMTLRQERMRLNTFGDCAHHNQTARVFRRVSFAVGAPRKDDIGLMRTIARFPFVPDDDARLNELCFEAYNIQTHGLRQRLQAAGLEKLVIGVSGGLDSSHALIVAVRAMDQLNLPRSNVLAYTLPGFATTAHTKRSAWDLMRALGVEGKEIDITPACMQMLKDLNHPFAKGEKLYDTTFENVQAGARTSLLFRLANQHRALVVGTGDLSELALGWCTYGVGDQMAHYNVNASVPKTLIQHLLRWIAATQGLGADAAAALLRVLATEITPELIPGEGAIPGQKTEDVIGPYALQDFNLYYTTRFGLPPSRICFMAWHAWREADEGAWPLHTPKAARTSYSLTTIKQWMRIFAERFFAQSQFKRSAMPNGPKVSSGGSLSPRGDWRAPSDASASAWLADVETVPEL